MSDSSQSMSKKERTDIIISIIVVLFFLWLFLFSGLLSKEKVNEMKGLVTGERMYDTDGDGIMDIEDLCPNIYSKNETGCPDDQDGDGVIDNLDKCPDEFGLARLNGCPDTESSAYKDSDDDGVVDNMDECPDLAAQTENGCPSDKDKDGVIDSEDECPNQFGVAENHGCPGKVAVLDTDGDGVMDENDECPDEVGTIENRGCPVVIEDTDGDGIADQDDRCPTEAGTASNDGCPELELEENEQQIIEEAVKSVEFVSGSDQLTEDSKKNLDQINSILEKYPKTHITITGHTDSQGDDVKNQELSLKRAQACSQYLVDHGIDASRIITIGKGESEPIASNDTAEGRRQNRRVDFSINY